MQMTNFLQSSRFKKIAIATVLGIYSCFLVAALCIFLYCKNTMASFGQLGDSFGVVNSLFSSISLLFVGFAFLAQQNELSSLQSQFNQQQADQKKTEQLRVSVQLLQEWALVSAAVPLNPTPSDIKDGLYSFLHKCKILHDHQAVEIDILKSVIQSDMGRHKARIEGMRETPVSGQSHIMNIPKAEWSAVKQLFFP